MNRHCEPGVRVTHEPTGESVSVRLPIPHRYRRGDIARAMNQAERLLAARLFHTPDGPPIRRSYHLSPDFYVGIRQDGEVLAKGMGDVRDFLDGRLPGQFGAKGEPQ